MNPKTKIYKDKLIILSLGFICFTIIGTLSHEYGHIFVAQKLGYTTQLHYGSMSWYGGNREETSNIYKEYKRKSNLNWIFRSKRNGSFLNQKT